MAGEEPKPPTFWLAGRFAPRQVDRIVVATALLLSIPQLIRSSLGGVGLAVALAMTICSTVPLLWRRTRPGTILVVVTAVFAVSVAFEPEHATAPGLLFAVYAAAMYGDRRTRLIAGGSAALILAIAFGIVLATGDTEKLGHLAGPAFGFGVAWVLGDRHRTRRAYIAELQERATRLERERERDTIRAAEEERIRIARELHDVVAHNVSAIVVQASASRVGPDESAESLRTTMGVIEHTARATLSELRSVLGVLRRDEASSALRAPQPTLARLDDLLARTREAGSHVQAQVEGDVHVLPATVDLSAYRIVQEGLTNVVKHAPGSDVRVSVLCGVRDIELVVEDDGPGPTPGWTEGHGLIGMRERATLVGGSLSVEPGERTGFRVRAWLPIEDGGVAAPAQAAPPVADTERAIP